MEPGTLTRVLHDFLTTVDGELSLLKGDYFLINTVIDKHWSYGQSHSRTGKFPLNYLHKVQVPQIQDTESLFISIAAFSGEQEGDLSFGEGELIVGIQEVETNWYLGYIDSRKGIFPTSHVWKLDSTLLKKAETTKKNICKKAKVKTSLQAQLDEELDLKEGEIVTVTEIFDDGWCRGITEDGSQGTFPEGFIAYIEESVVNQADTLSTMDNSAMQSLSTNDRIYKDFSEFSTVQHYEEEPAPNYYDLFPESKQLDESSQDVLDDNNLNPLGVKPYAITLFPFNAQFPNELSFAAGEVVHLIKHIDTEWAEGSIDNAKGIFPISYVNVIVNCIEVSNSQPSLTEEAPVTVNKYDALEPETPCQVEFTFNAQMNGDLSVTEGDIVTVVEMANDDWVSVKDKDGEVGLCPRGYLNPVMEQNTDPDEHLFDYVMVRGERKNSTEVEDQKSKRLSEPHRPAPPAPAPGRTPLQKPSPPDKNRPEESSNESDSADAASAALKQKKFDHRQNVISELVLTEKEYVRDLKITYETFHLYDHNFLESRGIDVTVLFGNIAEVTQVAEELLDKILRAMKGCDEECQTIGPCFLKMSDKMQHVYVKYCSNHEAALTLLKKYEENREAMAIFEKGIETLRHQIACFDMSSILIKPVQRILKYPLMLYELIKCTEDGHPDKPEIEEAWKAMTDVASYINEYKRRKDLIAKYFDSETTLMRKMAKLNMHSVAKMSTRLSAKLSASLGLTNLTSDPEFNELERKFRSIEKCLYQLGKDAEQSVTFVSEEALFGKLLADSILSYYQGTVSDEVRRLKDTRSVIWRTFLEDLRTCLQTRVLTPVNTLATLLEGPSMLITKRYDKLVDYDAAISRSERNPDAKIVQDELSIAKMNFEALNQQLLDELPSLIESATTILVTCIGAFTNSRKLLSGKITKRYLGLFEIATQVKPHDILESFLVHHSLLWNQITRFSMAGTNPRIEETQVHWGPQNNKQKMMLQNKFPPERLYIVNNDIVSTSALDIGAVKGTLVAVIKKQDPMGDTTRWFVNNGSTQGFLPSQCLKSLYELQRTSISSSESFTSQESCVDLMSLDSPEKEASQTPTSRPQSYYSIVEEESADNHYYGNVKEASQPQSYQNIDPKFYYAMYDFQGLLPGTLSVSKGQAVKVLQTHDQKNNEAWWLVEDRYGKTGYVPHNYLGPAALVSQ
ncbi:dynamin-binding protein [Cephus cinctus]|uniref:Dynamin-binding protein n=1 Tax=Cephus cinctus TaxID=211228 RepID=A0AAJ7FUX5_CEPCN|nr:dynamin-binding protein [Cephus cinctus]XP_024947779.1 dynamin-binding protein [Cephus cinctus]